MLATPADTMPTGSQWCHEIKWDGMRVLAHVTGDRLRLTSRTERDVSVAFPELTGAGAGLVGYDDLLLDGEAVVLRDGRPSFAALADRFNIADAATAHRLAAAAPVTFMAFDVLRAMGTPTTGMPWHQRRQLLDGLGLNTRWVQTPPVFDDGAHLLAATADQGLEGVVSKRRGSTYQSGRRSLDWRKTVHRRTDSFVVCGWLPEKDNTNRLGAVHLATPAPDGRLIFRGRVGSGLAGRSGEDLLDRLRPLRSPRPEFTGPVPPEATRGATWVAPDIVADVEFLGVTEGGQLRQPSWRGIRHDLTVQDLTGTPTADG